MCTIMLMRSILIALITILLLCSCSRHFHPLEAGTKARLVSEIIPETPQCSDFKSRLTLPTIDDDGIDDVYHAASRSHCIKKDI